MAKITVSSTSTKLPPTAVISPNGSSAASTNSSVSSDDASVEDISSSIGKDILMSDHRKAEVAGRFVPEPLLMDNPNRFVLFPIQDNEVRTKQTRGTLVKCGVVHVYIPMCMVNAHIRSL